MIAHLVRIFDQLTARERALLTVALAEQENFGNFRPRTTLDDRLCKHFVDDAIMIVDKINLDSYELTDKGVEIAVLCIAAEGEGAEA